MQSRCSPVNFTTETHCRQQFIDAPLEYPNKRVCVGHQQGYDGDEEIWDLNREKDHLLFGRNLMYQLAVSHQYMGDEKAKEGKGRSIRSSFRVHELRRQTFIPYLAHVGYPHRQNSVPSLRCSFQYHQQHLQTLLLVCCTCHKFFNVAVATY